MIAREELPTQSLELAREDLAAAVYDAVRSASNRVSWTELGSRSQKYWLDIADALLASPALARMIRKAKADAWVEGQTGGYICAQGHHAHGDGHGPDSWDCDCPNPYRDQTGETP